LSKFNNYHGRSPKSTQKKASVDRLRLKGSGDNISIFAKFVDLRAANSPYVCRHLGFVSPFARYAGERDSGLAAIVPKII
jgi:hypothetical protein